MQTATDLVSRIQASPMNLPLAELPQQQIENGRRSSLAMAVDQELAMVDLWQRMGELFGAKWLRQYGDTDSPAFETWCRYLSDLSAEQIKRGFVNLLQEKSRYLPDAVEFREMCLSLKSLGLPPARRAYEEACMKPSPKAEQSWSHPAVFHAGKNTGWHELASMPTEQIYPRFEYHYSELCKRVMSGDDLTVDVPQAIPATIHRTLSSHENKSRMAELRKAVGI